MSLDIILPYNMVRGQHQLSACPISGRFDIIGRLHGPVAQLGERRLCTAEVRSSSLLRSTSYLCVQYVSLLLDCVIFFMLIISAARASYTARYANGVRGHYQA